jgi:hypothetical protein
MALTKAQKAALLEKAGKLGQAFVKAIGNNKKEKQQNGNLSGCGGCTREEGK